MTSLPTVEADRPASASPLPGENPSAGAGPPLTVHTARGTVEYATTGAGPPLLALHGVWGGWDQALLLAGTVGPPAFRAIALSRPGYLGTALATGRSPEEQADLYAATLDALGVRRVAVLAISGGGRSAMAFARRHRARCWALVLVSTVGEARNERLPLSYHLKTWLAGRTWFTERLRRRIERDPDAAGRRAIPDPDLRARTLADPEVGPLFRRLLASAADRLPLRVDGTKQDVRAGRRPAPLEEVQVPTLVVHGTQDRAVPFERHGAVLARRIPGAELLAVPGADHVAVFTHRALIRARIETFLYAHLPA